MWLWLVPVSLAAEVLVPVDYSTLAEAVGAADSGDTVTIDGSAYEASDDTGAVTVSMDLTIRSDTEGVTVELPTLVVNGVTVVLEDVGFDPAALASLTFDSEGDAFVGLYTYLADVTWDRGLLSVPEGIGVYMVSSTVELVDVAMGGHTDLPTLYGGSSSLTLRGGDEDACTASNNDGPPIVAVTGTDVLISGCSFSDNRATLDARWSESIVDIGFAVAPYAAGGALWVLDTDASVEVTDTTFTDHAADDDGGVAFIAGGSSDWRNVTIIEAEAGGFGGALLTSSLTSARLELSLVDVDVSEVLAENGAIALVDTKATLSGVSVASSEARDGGAAFYLLDATVEGDAPTLSDLQADNGAAFSGTGCGIDISGGSWTSLTSGQGAVFVQDSSVSLEDLVIEGLEVDELGGLIAGTDATVVLAELEVELTGRPGFGGLVYLDEGSLTASSLTVVGLGADYGGLLWARDAEVTLMALELDGDGEPALFGGAVYGDGLALSVQGGALQGFSADDQGGVFFLYDSDTVLEDVAFGAATADEGAAIYQEQGSLEGSGLHFEATLARQGGALSLQEMRSVLLEQSWFCENVSEEGGSALDLTLGDAGTAELANLGIVGNVDAQGAAVQLWGDVPISLVQSSLVDNVSPSSMIAVNTELALVNTLLVGGARGLAGIRPVSGGYNLWHGQTSETVGAGYEDFIGADDVLAAPRLVDRLAGGCLADVHLRGDSPAIDVGDPDRSDADGTRSDIGVYGGVLDADYGDTDEPLLDTAAPGPDTATPVDSGEPLGADRAVLRNGCQSAGSWASASGWVLLLSVAGLRRRPRVAPTCRNDGHRAS